MTLAHAGHWLVSLLYLAPVAVIVGFVGWQSWRDRRSSDDDGRGDPPAPTAQTPAG
jgi:threonine/homoserine/homoserine lactone efflux protein